MGDLASYDVSVGVLVLYESFYQICLRRYLFGNLDKFARKGCNGSVSVNASGRALFLGYMRDMTATVRILSCGFMVPVHMLLVSAWSCCPAAADRCEDACWEEPLVALRVPRGMGFLDFSSA